MTRRAQKACLLKAAKMIFDNDVRYSCVAISAVFDHNHDHFSWELRRHYSEFIEIYGSNLAFPTVTPETQLARQLALLLYREVL